MSALPGKLEWYLNRLRCMSPAETVYRFTSAAGKRLQRLGSLTESKEVTVAQAALAYVLSQPLNLFAVVGCRDLQEYVQCAEALAVKLTPDEIEFLEGGEGDP